MALTLLRLWKELGCRPQTPEEAAALKLLGKPSSCPGTLRGAGLLGRFGFAWACCARCACCPCCPRSHATASP